MSKAVCLNLYPASHTVKSGMMQSNSICLPVYENVHLFVKIDYRSGSGDQWYPREKQQPAEMQKLLEEFRTLYHERLQRIDQSGDSSEESLQVSC